MFLILAIVWTIMIFILSEKELVWIGLIILLFPVLLVFAESIENVCLIKRISPKELTLGDWLYDDIIVGNRKIKANWDGVSKSELDWIRKKCKGNIFIKQGIPFTPGFLIGFIGLLLLSKYGFWI